LQSHFIGFIYHLVASSTLAWLKCRNCFTNLLIPTCHFVSVGGLTHLMVKEEQGLLMYVSSLNHCCGKCFKNVAMVTCFAAL